MTTAEYQALPPFFRGFSKEQIESQYRKNAHTLRIMALQAERKRKKVNGFTVEQLRERALEFERLSVPA